MRFLVVESETEDEREERRASAGKSAGETYAATLGQMFPDATVERVTPSDGGEAMLGVDEIAAFDAVFLSGSPLHAYCATPETERQVTFMTRVFEGGTPSFGSCAGLQVAVVAAGGRVRAMPHRDETGIARGIAPTPEGRDHPLLAGRPPAWDALAIHGDEVEELPAGAVRLAGNHATRVQAAEIRVGEATFWGVQYHPELAPGEIAAALRRQAETLVDDGTARSLDEVEEQAALFDRLHRDPEDRSVLWRLGVTAEAAQEERRRVEIANFVAHLVVPTMERRGRGTSSQDSARAPANAGA